MDTTLAGMAGNAARISVESPRLCCSDSLNATAPQPIRTDPDTHCPPNALDSTSIHVARAIAIRSPEPEKIADPQ